MTDRLLYTVECHILGQADKLWAVAWTVEINKSSEILRCCSKDCSDHDRPGLGQVADENTCLTSVKLPKNVALDSTYFFQMRAISNNVKTFYNEWANIVFQCLQRAIKGPRRI